MIALKVVYRCGGQGYWSSLVFGKRGWHKLRNQVGSMMRLRAPPYDLQVRCIFLFECSSPLSPGRLADLNLRGFMSVSVKRISAMSWRTLDDAPARLSNSTLSKVEQQRQ